MVTVTASTQRHEVPGIGAAAVDPVHDVVDLQPAGCPAQRVSALLVTGSTIRRVRSGTIRWERPTLTGRAPATKIGLIVPSQVYSRAIASGIAMPLIQVTAAVGRDR